MRRMVTTLALVATMLLATAPAALAGGGSASNSAPGNKGCQPGASNTIVHPWRLLDVDGFVDLLLSDEIGFSNEPAARAVAEPVYAFNDHNGDGYACVMVQHLPNYASGFFNYFIVEDNHPFGGR